MSDNAFRADGVFAGVPYRVVDSGAIEAIMAGRLVQFRSMEQFLEVGRRIESAEQPSPSQDAETLASAAAPTPVGMSKGAKVALWVVGVPLALFAAVLVLAKIDEAGKPKDAWSRIEQSCQREFGPRGQFAVDDCKINLGLGSIREAQSDALDRARRGAR